MNSSTPNPRPRRRRKKMGVRDTRRVFEVHRAFVRQQRCSIPGCQEGPIEFSHIGPPGSKGMRLKSKDWWGVSHCRRHHRRGHQIGMESMCLEAGTTLAAQQQIALDLAKRSPDRVMQARMREDGILI